MGGAKMPGTKSSTSPDAATLGPESFQRSSDNIETFIPANSPSASASSAKPGLSDSVISSALLDLGPRYRVEAKLGEGGMGAVYRAFDLDLNRTVALKIVRPSLTQHPELMQRFKQELLLASRVSHKNILRIHDLGDAGGTKYISMAFVDGQDLSQILKSQKQLPVERAVNIAKQLCAALEAAHAEGVVHRDLKPQNVLVGKNDTVCISDFGLATSLEPEAGIAVTRTGEMLGTPRYMSPEQVECKRVDGRSDIYSLGLILYEMVTGDVPFHGTSAFQLMVDRVQKPPKDPRLLNPNLPDYLVNVILRCLEKDVERRYQSAAEVLQDLNVGSATPSYLPAHRPARQGPSRLERRAGIITAVVLALLVAVGFAAWKMRGKSGAEQTAETAASLPLKYMAVLPLGPLGTEPSLKLAAQGITEALSAKLAQLKSVHLASARTAERLDPKTPPEKMAHTLGATWLLQGSVQGAGNKLRVIMSLWDSSQNRVVWTKEFAGLEQDLLTLEDQIFSDVVNSAQLNMSNEEQARAASHPTENMDAYEPYLKGRNALRGSQNIENIHAAIADFEEALRKDGNFALAYSGLADANLVGYLQTKDQAMAAKALSAAEQARHLNDRLPEVHLTLGSVYNATGKIAEANAELQEALQLSPNSDDVYRRLAQNYLANNKPAEAYAALKKAISINPYFWLNYYNLTLAYLSRGSYDNALASAKKVVELDPENSVGYAAMGMVYYRQGKYQQSIPQFEKSIQIQPNYSTYSNLGTAYFFLKNYPEAVKMYQKAVELNPQDQINMGNLADAYRASQQNDLAKATYEKAIGLALKDLRVNPKNANTLGSLALYYAKAGKTREAQQFIQRARAISNSDVGLMYNQAIVQTLSNEPEAAVKTLSEAFQKGYSSEEAKNDPEFSTLQGRQDFKDVIARRPAKK